MRVIVDENGRYAFQLYKASDPENIIETITTPIDTNPDHLISSIVEDDVTHLITITMQNGKSYTFNMVWNTPTAIAVLANRIKLSEGATASFEFRVNPSNASFNYDLDSDDCEIELDMVGTATRAFSSYVTAPTNYKLTKVEQTYTEAGVLKTGQYRAYVKDLGVSKSYDELMALVITVTNGAGEKVQISSSAIEVERTADVTEFKLLASANKGVVTKDVEAVIDGKNITFIADPSTILNTSKLVVSFKTNGGKVLVGTTEQYSGVSSQDFTSPVKYTIVSSDGDASTYTVTVNVSGMPYVYIDTPGGAAITSKVDWTKDSEITIIQADGQTDYADQKLQIRGRGNSTWSYPKKPYALKLDAKTEILGMPKHKRWVLLANWMDRTLLRNDVTFELARQTGLAWTPRGQFVEVVLNGKHIGCYYLCEQIKIDKNRVNITEMDEKDIEGEAVTGGYLMELDSYYDEVNKFKSAVRSLPYEFKDPDEDVLQPQQFSYFENYINTLEAALYSDNWLEKREYADYMDLETFADWWFVYELSMNSEPYWPKSSYMHKDRNGKLKAGPVWDFDYATYVPSKASSYTIKSYIYYGRLFSDPEFVSIVKTRWATQKAKFETIPAYIRKMAAQTKAANDINIKLWPISSTTNGDEKMTFDEAINRMIEAYETKLKWLDTQITAM